MTELLRLIKAFWELLAGWATDTLKWLRKPGSVVKVFCAVLAFGCMVAGLSAYEKEQRIKDLNAQVKQIQLDWRADAERLEGDVAERDQRLAEIAATLREEAAKLKVLKAESAEALKQLAGKIEAAEKDAASWRVRYEDRPDTCKAALELLDSACPDLKGY
jgi:chromosome segregation ATPase